MSKAVLSATVTRARSALLDNSSSGIARPVALAQVNLTNVKLFLSAYSFHLNGTGTADL
jgi:hypothetical protein